MDNAGDCNLARNEMPVLGVQGGEQGEDATGVE